MKQTTYFTKLERITLDLLTGLTIGLAVIIAVLTALATPIDLAVRWIHRRITSPTLVYRHP
jgi:hypothetical protein